MFKNRVFGATLLCGAALLLAQNAQAQTYQVQVGYADDLRPTPFFPMPWFGDAGVSAFLGTPSNIDAGAIRIINTGATPLTLQAFNVDSFGDGANFNIWGGLLPVTFGPGTSVILTQTTQYNFDSSDDQGNNTAAQPVVHLTIDGVSKDFVDTAQVLNTEGTDHLAAANLNESHQWREIGTFGGQAGVPEPGTMALLVGSGLSSAAFVIRRRRK